MQQTWCEITRIAGSVSAIIDLLGMQNMTSVLVHALQVEQVISIC